MRAFLPLFVLGVLTACGGEEADPNATQQTGVDSGPVAIEAETGDLRISGTWARTSLPPHDSSAAFLTIQNLGESDDALIDVEVDAARVSELHTMLMLEVDGDTRMRMEKVNRMAIPAGGELVLEPGAEHLMFFQLEKPWVDGDKVRLRLMFENSPAIELRVPVRAMR